MPSRVTYKQLCETNPEVRARRKAANTRFRELNLEKSLMAQAKHRAKKAGREFDLTLDDIILPVRCPVLGVEIERGLQAVRRGTAASIDRKNNSRGYTKDNIGIISSKANRLKSDMTIEQVRALLAYMTSENAFSASEVA